MIRTISIATLIAVFPATAVAAVQDDDFNDNSRGPQWSLIEDDANLHVVEQNGRLEALATGPNFLSDDALYLSNGPSGFRLATDADFEITIQYSFTSFVAATPDLDTAIALVFGVGRDAAGTDSAAIGFSRGNIFPTQLVGAHRIDESQFQTFLGAGLDEGTFVATYDAAGDDLMLGDGTTTYPLLDTVRDIWEADSLLVSFGVRGKGFTLASGDAYLDNFRIVSGHVVPEPSTLILLTTAALGLLAYGWRSAVFDTTEEP